MTGPRAVRAGSIGWLAAGIVLASCGGSTEAAISAAPPSAAVARLTAPARAVADMQLVLDFDTRGDRLYLLDAAGAQVAVLTITGGGWVEVVRFGRRGSGPGEFQFPLGIAVTEGQVLVADGAQLQRLSLSGRPLGSAPIATACPLQRARVLSAGDAVFVMGHCFRRARGADSMVAELYRVEADTLFRPAGSDVLFTRDGAVGSFLTTTARAAEADDRVIFGSGSTPCVVEVRISSPPAPARRCLDAPAAYAAAAPPELAARLEYEAARRPGMEAAFRWPETLPWFAGLIAVGGEDVLLRPWSADSLVFETRSDGRQLLVAPWNSLVGCRRGGCLWADATEAGVDIRLLSTGDLVRLIESSGRMP